MGCNPDVESLQKTLARNLRAIQTARRITEPDLISLGVPAGSAHRGATPGGQNMQLATLAKWAKALKVPAWALLHPDFQPETAFTVMSAEELEAEITRQVRERLQPLSALIGGLSDTEEPRPDGRSVALPYPDGPATAGKPAAATGPGAGKEKIRRR